MIYFCIIMICIKENELKGIKVFVWNENIRIGYSVWYVGRYGFFWRNKIGLCL